MAETELKKKVRPMFEKNWEKHYKVKALTDLGFERKICKVCNKPFWTLDKNREVCADSSCVGNNFIGKKTKEYSYTETWNEIEKFFTKKGHKSIPRYPVIPRWRSDLYFTNASIIDFQPYVVNGEVKPPADPLIVPQTSIRFGDISNVGVTGTHYTTFVMFGQHAFNSDPKKTYWKEQALSLDFEYLTKVIGVKEKDLVFKEDVWEGGGYYGPSMEYFANGVELGNCVFMEFQYLGNGNSKRLKNPVIDMGAGFERLAWYTNGTPTSYDVTFKEVLKYLKKHTGVDFPKKLLEEFYRNSSSLNTDEVKNLKKAEEDLAKKLGYERDNLFKLLEPVHALYAVADHTKTLLYTSTDGMLPSNSGGGYNLRILARRLFDINERFDFKLDFNKIFDLHVKSLENFDPTIKKGLQTSKDVLEEEYNKYKASKEKAYSKLSTIIKSNKELKKNDFTKLYKSDGITKEQILEVSKKLNKKIEIPEDYFELISESNKANKIKSESNINKVLGSENKEIIQALPNTQKLYYDSITESTSKIIYSAKNFIILDKTVFYPEGGGQAYDKGTINGAYDVKEVYNYNGKIIHVLDNSKKDLKIGNNVICLVDIERQQQLRSQHTATHLLNAACGKILGQHIWQAGAHKGVDISHLDVTHYKNITNEQLHKIEELVNDWVFEAHKVNIFTLPKDQAEKKYGFRLYQGGAIPGNQLRIIEIPGIDVEACAGLHLSNTSQVGIFKILKRTSVQDGVERIFFTTYKSALRYIKKQEELLDQASDVLSVARIELPKTINNFFKEWKEQRKEINNLRSKIAEYESTSIINTEDKKVIAKFNLDRMDLAKILAKVQSIEKSKDKSIAIYNNNGYVFIWQGPKSKVTIDELKKELEEKLKVTIKGGGKIIFQGKFVKN